MKTLNLLDRTIAAISPQWAYKRQAWRRGSEVLYDSASRGRLNMNWNPSATVDENRMRADRELIRARARDLERNSDIADSIIDAFERNVVGAGMTLQAKIEGVPNADELNRQIEKLWKEFSKKKNCDITASQSLEEIEEMLIRRYVVDGGILIVKVYTDDEFPFKLQVRDVDDLNPLITSGEGGRRVVEGIEIDDYGKPIAYHFKKYNGVNQIHGESVRIEAKDVLYWYNKTMPKQIRERSLLATAINRIKDANQFIEAVSIKERVLACLAVFIKKDMPSTGLGRGVNTPNKSISYDGVSLAPGMIGELNPGDEVQTVVPSGQASNTKEFITTLIRLIGSGLGLSYEAISRDLSTVNYSSARQGLIEDRKTYRKKQRSMISTVLTPIYEEFLDSMVLAGKLNIPDYAINKEVYLPHVWIPPGQQWIDPVKEVTANKTALESNQDTLARICAEKGEDWRDVVKQRAEETKYMNELMGGAANAESTETAEGAD